MFLKVNTMQSWLEKKFNIREGEFTLVESFFLFFIGIGMFYTVGATVGDTLFLSSLSSESVPVMLPWVYAGIAAGSLLSTILYDAIQQRISRAGAIIGTQAVLAVSVILFRQIIHLDNHWIYFVLVIWMEVCALLSITLFFSFAGDYFSSRAARRLYGFIVGGMALGTVVAGYAISAAVVLIGTRNLLYFGACLLFMNAFISWRIYRTETPAPSQIEADDVEGEKVSLKAIFDRPFVRLVAVMMTLAIIISVVVDYQMKWIASTKSEEELARFFGTFWGLVGVAQLLFQFLIVPRLLRRLGIINCLMILPLMIALASILLLSGSIYGYMGFGILIFSAAANFLRITLSETLDLPSREMLFLPLPTRIRLRAQPFMNGAMSAAARGIGALFLLFLFYLGVAVQSLSAVVLLFCLLLIVSLLKLRPSYRETLAATLRSHKMDAFDLQEVVQSPAVNPMIEELLRSRDPNAVRFTLRLMRDRKIGTLGPVLEDLQKSSDTSIVVEVLKCYGTDAGKEFVPLIRRSLLVDNKKVREAAVLALCQACGSEVIVEVSGLLDSDDEVMRHAAVIGLARYCGTEGRKRVHDLIQDYVARPESEKRSIVAGLIGRIGQAGYMEELRRLMIDRDLDVIRQALKAVSNTREAELIPDLLRAMKDPELRHDAAQALMTMPYSGIKQLVEKIHDPDMPDADRRVLLQVISRIGGPDAAVFLWDGMCLTDNDLIFRFTAAQALRSLRRREGIYTVRLKEFNSILDTNLHYLELLNTAYTEVRGVDAFAAGAYRDHARLVIEIVLSLFALKYDPRQIDRILFNLFSEMPATRATAMELLDEMLPRKYAHRVVSLLQSLVDDRKLTGSGLRESTIEHLLDCEPWIRAVTAYHLSESDGAPDYGKEISLSRQEKILYTKLDMVSFFKAVPMFRDIPANYLLEQVGIAQWVELKKGEILFRQGDKGDALYIIAGGETDIVIGGKTVARTGKGECIGEMALLDDEPRSATVKMATDGRLMKISEDAFMQMLVAQPSIAKALLKTLDQRIRRTQAGRKPQDSEDDLTMTGRVSVVSMMAAPDLHQIVPIISFLYEVDMFRDLPMHSLTRLAGIVQEVNYYSGEDIFAQGDVGDSFYIVCSGSVDIVVNGNTVASLGENKCLGEMALIGGGTRSATARVSEDSRMLRLWAEDFDQLLATEPDVTMALLRTLARRLRNITA